MLERSGAGPAALDGVTAIELAGGTAPAVAGMLLADNGARVIKVEPPQGAPERTQAAHRVWNRGKESLVLDLGERGERDLLARLLAGADVLLHGYRASEEPERGLDPADLALANPRLVTCAITGYGPRGPLADRPGDDALVCARLGLCADQPGWLPGPSHIVLPLPSLAAALLAVQGILAALLARAASGRGQHVETSLLAGMLGLSTPLLGQKVRERGSARPRAVGPSPFYSAYECADGTWLQLGCIHTAFVTRATLALGIADEVRDLVRDPGFANGVTMRSEAVQGAFYDVIGRAMRRRPYAEWARALEAADVPFGPVRTTEEFIDDPQGRVNGVARVVDPEVGPMEQMGLPVRLGGTPGRVRGPAPLLDQHGAAIRSAHRSAHRNGAASAARSSEPARRDPARPPLAGIRVLEVANLIAGPMTSRFLADLGADVIKLESPDGGDIARRNGGPAFFVMNAGKRGIAVNLKLEEGRRIGQALARAADVVLDNMRPGAMERLGIGWEELRIANPRLVSCHVSAYGSRGPYAHQPGLDPVAGGLAGVQMAQGGYRGKPVYQWAAAVDHTASLLACVGVLVALLARDRDGAGQRVETSLLDAAVFLNGHALTRYPGRPPRHDLPRSQYGFDALRRLYETADGWIYVAARSPRERQAFLSAIGRPELRDDAPTAGDPARTPADEPLARAVAEALATRRSVEWAALLDAAGVPCAPAVAGYERVVFDDPQVLANDLLVTCEHPALGTLRFPHRMVRLSDGAVGCGAPPPLLGQHTPEVLGELGYAPSAIEELRGRGVVTWEEVGTAQATEAVGSVGEPS